MVQDGADHESRRTSPIERTAKPLLIGMKTLSVVEFFVQQYGRKIWQLSKTLRWRLELYLLHLHLWLQLWLKLHELFLHLLLLRLKVPLYRMMPIDSVTPTF
jgi:hypothetical protein